MLDACMKCFHFWPTGSKPFTDCLADFFFCQSLTASLPFVLVVVTLGHRGISRLLRAAQQWIDRSVTSVISSTAAISLVSLYNGQKGSILHISWFTSFEFQLCHTWTFSKGPGSTTLHSLDIGQAIHHQICAVISCIHKHGKVCSNTLLLVGGPVVLGLRATSICL